MFKLESNFTKISSLLKSYKQQGSLTPEQVQSVETLASKNSLLSADLKSEQDLWLLRHAGEVLLELARANQQKSQEKITTLAEKIQAGKLTLKPDPFLGEYFKFAADIATAQLTRESLLAWWKAYKQSYPEEILLLGAAESLLTNELEDIMVEDSFVTEAYDPSNTYRVPESVPMNMFLPPVIQNYQQMPVSQETSAHMVEVVIVKDAQPFEFTAELLQPIRTRLEKEQGELEMRLKLTPEDSARKVLRSVEDNAWTLCLNAKARASSKIPSKDISYQESFAEQLLVGFRAPSEWQPLLSELDKEGFWQTLSSIVIQVEDRL